MHQPTMVQVEASQDSSRRLAASTNGQPTNGRFKSHLHGIHGNTETPPQQTDQRMVHENSKSHHFLN